MKTAIIFFLSFTGSLCYAQEQKLDGRFVRFNLQGSNEFAVRSNSSPDRLSFNSSESHSISGQVGYGWFYKNKKSIYFGAGTAINYDYSRVTREWSNTYFATVQKTAYKNLYNNTVFFSFAQEMEYAYGFNRIYSTDPYYSNLKNPTLKTHQLSFALKPGIFYRHNKNVSFTLELDLLSFSVHQQKYASVENTSLRYNVLSNYNIAAIQIGFLWFPGLIQSKKQNDL